MEPVDVAVVQFSSADGTVLEGELLWPADAVGSAVVCHPHPLHGGSRQDAVVGALTRALVGARRRVLRFDFRGAGGSTGTYGEGAPEQDDLRAAIDTVIPTGEPLVIAGYSFGADIALSVAHPAATRWIAVAPPLAIFAPEAFLAGTDPRPVDLFVAAHDQFNPPDRAATTTNGWEATTIHVIERADHFFAGTHGELTQRVGDVVSS